jgi:hypothetical protein
MGLVDFGDRGFTLFPYYVAIIETYDDFGVPSGDITAIVVFFVVTSPRRALGRPGLRRQLKRTAASA